MSRKHRVLIVDDHPIVRHGLSQLLAGDPEIEVCGEADDVPAAVSLARATQPDMVVLDISLKTSHGLDLINQLRDGEQPVRILVWSMFDESLFAERVLRAGADGYISKQEPIEQVVAAVRQVLAGQTYLSPRMAERLVQRSLGRGGAPTEEFAALSDRELQVFELLGQGLTTQKIAHRLQLSVKTVAGYREKLKVKLGACNASELAHRAAAWFLAKSHSPEGRDS